MINKLDTFAAYLDKHFKKTVLIIVTLIIGFLFLSIHTANAQTVPVKMPKPAPAVSMVPKVVKVEMPTWETCLASFQPKPEAVVVLMPVMLPVITSKTPALKIADKK